MSICVWIPFRLKQWRRGECVKEKGEDRYCWRAGVMSRNEGEEEEGLFVWTVFFFEKAHPMVRVTVVREGMPVCEERVIGSTLQCDVTGIIECFTPFISRDCCEFGQVYLSTLFIITTSHNQFTRVILLLETESLITQSNGNQLRKIYSSFSL